MFMNEVSAIALLRINGRLFQFEKCASRQGGPSPYFLTSVHSRRVIAPPLCSCEPPSESVDGRAGLIAKPVPISHRPALAAFLQRDGQVWELA